MPILCFTFQTVTHHVFSRCPSKTSSWLIRVSFSAANSSALSNATSTPSVNFEYSLRLALPLRHSHFWLNIPARPNLQSSQYPETYFLNLKQV